jgi:hypothetical protein
MKVLKAKLIFCKRPFEVNFFQYLQNLLKIRKIFISKKKRKMQFWLNIYPFIRIDAENKLMAKFKRKLRQTKIHLYMRST